MKNQVQLITYVDRLSGGGLRDLQALLSGPLHGVFGGVHLLPFFYPIDGADFPELREALEKIAQFDLYELAGLAANTARAALDLVYRLKKCLVADQATEQMEA